MSDRRTGPGLGIYLAFIAMIAILCVMFYRLPYPLIEQSLIDSLQPLEAVFLICMINLVLFFVVASTLKVWDAIYFWTADPDRLPSYDTALRRLVAYGICFALGICILTVLLAEMLTNPREFAPGVVGLGIAVGSFLMVGSAFFGVHKDVEAVMADIQDAEDELP